MIPEIPVDAKLVNARHEFPNALQIIIEHPSFEPVEHGKLAPSFDFVFTKN